MTGSGNTIPSENWKITYLNKNGTTLQILKFYRDFYELESYLSRIFSTPDMEVF
jgi:hypothetical protein